MKAQRNVGHPHSGLRHHFATVLVVLFAGAWHVQSARAQRPSSRPDGGTASICDTVALGTLTGDVTKLDGSPAVGAHVAVFWRDVSISTDGMRVVQRMMRLSAPVGANGVYLACNIPLATTLLVQVVSADGTRGSMIQGEIHIPNVRFVDLAIGDGTTRVLRGRVVDANHAPVGAAQVSLIGIDRTVSTDATGDFRIPDVPSGTQMIEVSMLGYDVQHVQVDVGRGEDPLEVDMSHKVVMLDSMKIVATGRGANASRYLGFENRRENGFGYFVTARQIADMKVLSTDEILRRVPSVRVLVKHTRTGDSLMVTSTRGQVSLDSGANETICTLDIYVDGRRGDVSDIQMMAPSELHGIEVHSVTTLPAQYRASRCGAVLIWTK